MASQNYVNGVTLSDAGEFNRFDMAAYAVLSGVAGTNTITATGSANYTYLAANVPVWFIPAATNTGATTINITPSGSAALGARNVFWNGAACVGGELRIGVPAALIDDGTRFHIVSRGFNTPLTLATEQVTTSGTSWDFTVASGAKRITVMFKGFSTNGTSNPLIQLAASGSPVVTGYLGTGGAIFGASAANFTTGFGIASGSAANVLHGAITLNLENAAAFLWVASGTLGASNASEAFVTAGSKSLASELTGVRITTVNGTDAGDAGAISVSYE